MSTACGCTNAVGSTTGTRPSRLYAGIVISSLRRLCLRARASPGEEGADGRSKLLRAQLRAEDARLRVDPRPDLIRLAAQQSTRLEELTLPLQRLLEREITDHGKVRRIPAQAIDKPQPDSR